MNNIYIDCHICNSQSLFLMTKDDFDLFRCTKCSLVFVYPQPSSTFLQKEVYSLESGFQANRAEILDNIKEDSRYNQVINYMVAQKNNACIMDVGCGGGHFMYWAKKKGLSPVGVELNARVANSARSQGFEVFNGFLHDAPYEKNKFDFIFLGEVIEHVNSPRCLIRTAKNFINSEGALIITTPNTNCFWSRVTLVLYKIFKIPWSTATPPYHLFQFDNKNLDLLLEQEGFYNEHTKYLLPPRLMYELGSLHLLKRYKRSRNFRDLFFLIFAFSIYIIFYYISIMTHYLVSTDFSMIKVYKKVN